MSDDLAGDEGARRGLAVERDLGKVLGPGAALPLDQGDDSRADPAVQMPGQRRVTGGAQAPGAFVDKFGGMLGHAGGRGSGPGAVGEDVQEGEPRVLNEGQGVLEGRFALGGKAGDQIGAEGCLWTRTSHRRGQGQGVGARVPPLHALEDEVVARLQGEVQVGHESRLGSDQTEQPRVDLGRVNR